LLATCQFFYRGTLRRCAGTKPCICLLPRPITPIIIPPPPPPSSSAITGRTQHGSHGDGGSPDGRGGGGSKAGIGTTTSAKFLFSAIENRNVRERQHVDNRSTAELHQDCASLAAIDAFSDPTMASDANVGRGLKTVIPLSRTVDYRAVDGTTRPMTFARAMAAEKRRGEVVSIADNTPPAIISSATATRAIVRSGTIWSFRGLLSLLQLLPLLLSSPWRRG
jgi:hypothetical protein